MKNWFAAVVFSLISVVHSSAYAKDLPDFTELAEKQGPAVVNISITQNMRADTVRQLGHFDTMRQTRAE